MCSINSSHMYRTHYCHVCLHNCNKNNNKNSNIKFCDHESINNTNNNIAFCDHVSTNNSPKHHIHFYESFFLQLIKKHYKHRTMSKKWHKT
jgi:hypothetical protein